MSAQASPFDYLISKLQILIDYFLAQDPRFASLIRYEPENEDDILMYGYDVTGHRYHLRAVAGSTGAAAVWEQVKFDVTTQQATYSTDVVADSVGITPEVFPAQVLPPA